MSRVDGSAPLLSNDAEGPEALAFEIREGAVHNHFSRRGRVAAHTLVTSGLAPRLLVAFPAGNTGVGLWFSGAEGPIELEVVGKVEPIERPDGLRGVTAILSARASRLVVESALLGSVRALRQHAHGRAIPAALDHRVERSPDGVLLSRTRLDGRRRVALHLEPIGGTTVDVGTGGLCFEARERVISFRATALADDPPLTPIPMDELLAGGRSISTPAEERARAALAFLAYEEKLLGGSWRFLTYFGRDTLLSLQMLLPALGPRVVEAGLGAVLERLGPGGQVAHEESIGEWAAHLHLSAGRPEERHTDPIYDDTMIDDDFLLAPAAAAYLLDSEVGRSRSNEFLARRTSRGEPFGEALAQNLGLVLRLASPFALDPSASTLLALKEGSLAGEWRDSDEGLGGGRVPFNVNAVLVPAALEAAGRLFASDLYRDPLGAAQASRLAEAWSLAEGFFRVEIEGEEARRRVLGYAASLGLDAAAATASLEGLLSFPALALDARGEKLAVMHSDDGFMLLYGRPSLGYLAEAAERVLRPFPAGLRTPVGILVANPAYCPDGSKHAMFTASHYHGTVVWSWQQAMLAAGLERQLERDDLPAPLRASLSEAKRVLREVIEAAGEHRTAELWTFAHRGGSYERVPFGEVREHQEESNAVQLWSTVFLGLPA